MEGPEHAPTFVTVVLVDGEIAGRGRGTTKKAAQQEAAAEALSRMVADAAIPTLMENQTVFITDAFLVLESKELLIEGSVVPSIESVESVGEQLLQ